MARPPKSRALAGCGEGFAPRCSTHHKIHISGNAISTRYAAVMLGPTSVLRRTNNGAKPMAVAPRKTAANARREAGDVTEKRGNQVQPDLLLYFPSNSSTAAVIAVTPVLIVGSGTGR